MPPGLNPPLLAPPVLCDGAMGTELYAHGGVSFDRCLVELAATVGQ